MSVRVSMKTRPDTLDNAVVDEVFSGVYTKRLPLSPGDIVADVGAHIGSFTVLAGVVAKEVHAFEPQPGNYELLRENVEANRLSNVRTYNVAVGDKGGEAEISTDRAFNTGGYSLGKGALRVRVVTLDSVLDRLDFLKVDVEGYEARVLAGAKALLEKNDVKVAMEVHSKSLLEEVQAILKGAGYANVYEETGGYNFSQMSRNWMLWASKECCK